MALARIPSAAPEVAHARAATTSLSRARDSDLSAKTKAAQLIALPTLLDRARLPAAVNRFVGEVSGRRGRAGTRGGVKSGRKVPRPRRLNSGVLLRRRGRAARRHPLPL